jgi:ATP-dependent Lhr-like helicase
VAFGRLGLRAADAPGSPPRRGGSTPSPATPISLFRRADLGWLLAAARDGAVPDPPRVGAALEVVEALGRHGALFVTDLCQLTGRLPGEVVEALWDGMARGLLTADGFQAVRTLLSGRGHRVRASSFPGRSALALHSEGRPAPGLPRPGRPRPRVRPAVSGGRWSLLGGGLALDEPRATAEPGGTSGALRPHEARFDADELAEATAGQLLARWGVVFRDLVLRESLGLPWRDVLWALRRLEARGVVSGGRFVSGFTGEQFALPEAYEQLRASVKRPSDGQVVRLSATDPLNLTGVILPGPRIPAQHARTITLRDGALVEPDHDRISVRGSRPG